MRKAYLALLFILMAFLLTRLFEISRIPPSLYWDEASIGYNAYSILKTGKDEWGVLFPIHFRSFGEFKLPIYIYSTILSIWLFGLNEFAVRIPAVFYSLGCVILTFLISQIFFKNRIISLYSAFFMVISPWFFIISRIGYEANAGLMFYLAGIYLFILFLEDKSVLYKGIFQENIKSYLKPAVKFTKLDVRNILLLFSVISLILSMYSYNSYRVLVPLTAIFLLIYLFYKRIYVKIHPFIILACIVTIVLSILPIVKLFKYDAGLSRFQSVSIFNQADDHKNLMINFTKNYLNHFSPNFLLFNGDINLRSQQKNFGQLYWFDLILIVFGVLYVLRHKRRRLLSYMLFYIVLIGPVPAALTFESPHALRSLTMVPMLLILASAGLYNLTFLLKQKTPIYICFCIFYFASFSFYVYNFLTIYPNESYLYWQYPYKQLYQQYKEVFDDYDSIVITDNYAQPYIFALFYMQYNPNNLNEHIVYTPLDKWGFSTVSQINKLTFGLVQDQKLPHGKLLIFATPEEKIKGGKNIGEIVGLDHKKLLIVYEYYNI